MPVDILLQKLNQWKPVNQVIMQPHTLILHHRKHPHQLHRHPQ